MLTLDVTKPTKRSLFLGTSGDVAVSLNGRYLGQMTGLRTSHPDQLEAPLDLRVGKNILILSLSAQRREPLRLFLRLEPGRHARASEIQLRPWEASDGWPSEEKADPVMQPSIASLSAGKSARARLRRAVLKRTLGLPDRVLSLIHI